MIVQSNEKGDVQTSRRTGRADRLHRVLVEVLLNALNAGHAPTARHSRRVADLVDAIFTTYQLARAHHATLRVAALLHDMGKIDDRFFDIVHSREHLSAEQWAEIKFHPVESALILEPLELFRPGIREIVASHHERWDGQGYPRGLAADQIPLGARVITVADVFDAMTQPRSYKGGKAIEEALDELRRGAGSRFAPDVVNRLDDGHVLERWHAVFERGRSEESQPE